MNDGRELSKEFAEEDEVRAVLQSRPLDMPPYSVIEARRERGRVGQGALTTLAVSVAVIGLAIVFGQNRAPEPAAASPLATNQASASVGPRSTVSGTPPIAWAALHWSAPAQVPDALSFASIVYWRDALVASAEVVDNGAREGAAFRSTDGLHWQRVATFASPPMITITKSYVLAFVNLTTPADRVQTWSSSDAMHWQQEPRLALPSASLSSVAVRGDDVIALGTAGGTAALWRASGGAGWSPLVLPSAQTVARGLSSVPDGFLIFGREGQPDRSSGGVGIPGTGRPAAWWSTDGASWKSVPVEGSELPGAQLSDMFAVGNGYAALGSNSAAPLSSRSPSLWTSKDGHSWALVGTPPHWGKASSNGRQLVVFAPASFGTTSLGAWLTIDGRSWSELAFVGTPPSYETAVGQPTRIDSLFATPTGVLAIGQFNGSLSTWFAEASAH